MTLSRKASAAEFKLVPPGHCPTCGQPTKKARRRVCGSCGRPILRGHRYYFDGQIVRHRVCESPKAFAPIETEGRV
jgi:hypothetical protein